MWFVFGFALFSFMGTKFHHYIVPAVPPVAMLIGIVLHDMLGDRAPVTDPGEVRRMAHERIMLAGAAVAGALVVALVTRDLGRAAQAGEPPGAIRLLQLFTYNYRRTWPDTIDFSTTLTVFGAIAGVLMLVLAVPRIRRGAVTAMLAFGGAWAVWGLDVYMARMSPHWGQYEVIEAYYANRAGPDEPLVAYQMNWKGENFYAGNHLAVFVSTGPAFTSWLKQQRDKGVRVMYFVTEPSRMGGLRNEVAGKAYRELTDRALCNKFVMVRAEL